ncbi:MAG: carbohydrate kinase family protein, partial [bacterium]
LLIKHEEYKRVLPDFGSPKWIYLSSIGEDSEQYQVELADYLESHPDIKVAFQPGTYQIRWGTEGTMGRLYKRAEVSFCNKEEAQKILNTEESDIKKLMELMRALGPKIVVITDGPNGAYAYDGTTYWQMPLYPDPKPPVDRTGAGDAFSSTFTVALALGKTIPEALAWGPINSMSVVQDVGAQRGLLTREQIEDYLAKAPAEYRPKEI